MVRLGPLALALGCATVAQQPSVAEFRGRYTPGFEVSRFIACGTDASDQPWWVILSEAALRQRDSLIAVLPDSVSAGEVFVRWRAAAGAQEPAGHQHGASHGSYSGGAADTGDQSSPGAL